MRSAGAATSRYYGDAEELLTEYVWYQKNSQDHTWPVGILKPNDLGFFDIVGNVYTWCSESSRDYAVDQACAPVEDQEDGPDVISTVKRARRGCSYTPCARDSLCLPQQPGADESKRRQRDAAGEDFGAIAIVRCVGQAFA